MKLFKETKIHELTELWFKWIEWLLICAALNIFAIKSGSQVSWGLFFISSGLCAYTIGHTAIDIGFHGVNQNTPKSLKLLRVALILLMPLLLVIALHNLVSMVART
jgi:hypothetical protein